MKRAPAPTSPPTQTRGLPESFYKEQLTFDITPICSELKRILIFHGTDDQVVPPHQGQMLYKLSQEPKKLVLQENGDHQMHDRSDQINFMDEAVEWFGRWFDEDGIHGTN